MKRTVAFAAIALGLTWANAFAEPNADRQTVVKAGIRNLLASVDVYSASEKPRLGKAEDGSVVFFSARPNASAAVDAWLRSAKPDDKALGFLRQHAAAFGVYSKNLDFQVERVQSEKDRSFVRLGQTYCGIPVFGAEVVVQLDASDNVAAVSSSIMKDADSLDALGTSPTPAIAAKQAEAVALEWAHSRCAQYAAEVAASLTKEVASGAITLADAESTRSTLKGLSASICRSSQLVVFDPAVIGEKGDPCLAWDMTAGTVPTPVVSERMLVDAGTGSIAHSFPLAQGALYREIWDSHRQETIDPNIATLRREEGDGPTMWISVNNAYINSKQAYDYFNTRFGWDGLDNSGSHLKIYLWWTLGLNIDDWGAWYYPVEICGEEFIAFGPGEFEMCDDVMAHEYLHGIVAHNCKLSAAGCREAWTLSEGLADSFGELVDRTGGFYPDTNGDWLFGEDSVGPPRNMANPGSGLLPGPSYYKEPGFWSESTDSA